MLEQEFNNLEFIEKELKKFSITDQALADLECLVNQCKIMDINDKEGYTTVKKLRIEIKNNRVEVEKKRKELVADALTYQRAINSEAKRITSILEPLEDRLMGMQKEVDDYHERIRQEKKAEEERIRLEQLEKERLEQEAILAARRAEIEAEAEKIRQEQEKERLRLEEQARIQKETEEKTRLELEAIHAVKMAEIEAEKEKQRLIQEDIDRRLKEIDDREQDKYKGFQKESNKSMTDQQRIAQISFDRDAINNECESHTIETVEDFERERLMNESANPGSGHDPLVTGTEFAELSEDLESLPTIEKKESIYKVILYIEGTFKLSLLSESREKAIEETENLLRDINNLDVEILDSEAYKKI